MRKKLLISLILISTIYLSGCGNKTIEAENITDTESKNTSYSDEDKILSHNTVSLEDGPERKFNKVPLYYQQDYADIPYGISTIGKSGSLVTCLAMMESYSKADYITPKKLLSEFPSLMDEKDTLTMMDTIASANDLIVVSQSFDPYVLADYLNNQERLVLLEIPHASSFGSATSYILITGTTPDGDLVVRDADYNNIEKFAINTKYDELVYSATSIVLEAGRTSMIHAFTYQEGGE